MLEKFLRVYTIIVGVVIVICLALGLWYMFGARQQYRAYLCIFLSVLAWFILYVTRSMSARNIRRRPTERQKRVEEHKN